MMSVISAQSTDRKAPAPIPTRMIPSSATGMPGAIASKVIPVAPKPQAA